MEELKQKYCNWAMVYAAITVFATIAIETSHHVATALPSIIVALVSILMGFKFIGKFNKLEKQEKFEEVQRKIDKQERRARVKSFYKK